MGDFLSNLTARTFQPTAQVQPRLPTRFEPAHHQLIEPGQPMPLENSVEIEAPAVGSAPATQPRLNSLSHLPAYPPVNHSVTPAWAEAQPTPTQTQVIPADQPLSVAIDPENKPSVVGTKGIDPYFRTTLLRNEPAPPMSDHAIDESEPNSGSVDITSQTRIYPPYTPTTAMPLLQQRPAQPEMLITPLIKEQTRFAVLPTLTKPTSSPTASRPLPALDQDKVSAGQGNEPTLSTPPSGPAALAEMAKPLRIAGLLTSPATRQASPFTVPTRGIEQRPPAPTINITIGRIEVRATPPPASTAKPATAKNPTLSLDEYLRRRGPGGPA